MITIETPFDELAKAKELYCKAADRFRKLEMERLLTSEELFRYADIQRKAGNIEEAVRLFSACGKLEQSVRARFFADRLRGLNVAAPADLSARPCPAPLMLLPGFLGPEERKQILNFFLEHESEFTPARYNFGEYDAALRNNLELAGSRSIKPLFRAKVAGALPHILRQMGIAPFLVKKIEVKLRLYQNGQYFRVHTDGGQGRRLTFTYYLREKAYEGGDLIVFDTTANGKNYSRDFTRVLPEDNCLYCFPSIYFHAVTPVKAATNELYSGRIAINGHVSERAPDSRE